MDKMKIILVYLRNLMRAEVRLNKGNCTPVSFNGASTCGDFNCRLMTGEIMLTTFLADLVKRAAEDKELMRIVCDRFKRVSSLYIYDKESGWNHRYLTIYNENKQVSYKSLSQANKESINEFLALQRESFEKQKATFFYHETEGTDRYRILLSDTELVELSTSIYCAERTECLSGEPSRIGITRFLAHCFGISFPKNYDTLVAQLKERNSATLFLDILRKSLIGYLRKISRKIIP